MVNNLLAHFHFSNFWVFHSALLNIVSFCCSTCYKPISLHTGLAPADPGPSRAGRGLARGRGGRTQSRDRGKPYSSPSQVKTLGN